jgi:hypothetical protein
VAKEGKLYWSQPEILLYDSNPEVRMSYPDLIEQDGRFWITETQKTMARVHLVDRSLLEGLWNQGADKQIARDGLVLELRPDEHAPGEVRMPKPLSLAGTTGMSVELWARFEDLSAGQILLDCRGTDRSGFALSTTDKGTVQIEMSDGKAKVAWDCDSGILQAGKLHHLVVIADAGPRVLTFVVDGVLCDGGPTRPFGWTRFPEELANVTGSGMLRIAPSMHGQVSLVRLYDRYLRTSEAVANFHAGPIVSAATDAPVLGPRPEKEPETASLPASRPSK